MPEPKKYADSAARQHAYRRRQQAANSLGTGFPLSAGIRAMPSHFRWKAMQEKARVLLAAVVSEMEDYAGDRSDEWQDSDKANAFEEKLDLVREAIDAIEAIA